MGWGDRSGRIDREALRHIWQQIADDIAADIATGELPPRSKLPSQDDLAEVYGVARPTIGRALEALIEQGLLTVMLGRGTFVAERPSERDQEQDHE